MIFTYKPVVCRRFSIHDAPMHTPIRLVNIPKLCQYYDVINSAKTNLWTIHFRAENGIDMRNVSSKFGATLFTREVGNLEVIQL